MKKEELHEEIGKIDEDIIEEADKVRNSAAETAPKRKKPIFVITSVFVAAAAAVTGVVVIPKVIGNNDIPTVETTTAAVTTPADTGKVNVLDGETDPKDIFTRERRKSDIVSEVKALSAVGDSIAYDSGFSIKLSKDISEDELRSRIRLSPQSEFTLTRESDSSYLLKASKSFDKGSLIKLAVADTNGDVCDSWAFRTADSFSVYSTYPADSTNYVPTDSGIEIKFTSAPADEDPGEYFDIKPSVKGNFKIANSTLYFVPEDGLLPATTYTVTLKDGIKSADGTTLEKGTSFRFRTSEYTDRGNYMFTSGSASGFSETFLTGDPACVEIHCSDELLGKPFETHLYSFAGTDAYYDALKAKSAESFDLAGLPEGTVKEVFKSSETPFSRDGDRAVYVILPDDLEPGCYVAEITAGAEGEPGYTLDYFIQVSDISVYTLSLGEENVFFVNDSATGLPAVGAKITISAESGTYTGEVGADGLAYIKTDGSYATAMLDITAGTKRYIDSIILSGAKDMKYDDLYYTYLFTDREAYLPDDTVNVWGVIIPRVRGTAAPDDLKLVFGSEEQAVVPGADGTFTAKFTFTKHAETWWEPVALCAGETTLFSHYFSVRDYVKPTYVIDIESPDYAIMPQNDPVSVKVKASYYEGTPAEGLTLSASGQGSDPDILKTDSTGEAEAKVWYIDNGYSSYNSWRVSNFHIGYTLTGVEDSYSSANRNIPAIYRDRMLETDYNEETRTLTLHAYDFDFGKADKFFAEYSLGNEDYDILRKGGADIPVNVVITRSWNEKTETGSYYDYVEKRTIKTYDYEYKTEVVYDRIVNTVNGAAVLADLPTDPELGRYQVEISYKDSLGQPVEETLYSLGNSDYFGMVIYNEFGEPVWYGSKSENTIYRLSAKTKKDRSDDYAYYSAFSENEDISFRLSCSSEDSVPSGKLLIAVYKSDLVSYEVYDVGGRNEFAYRTTADCIPNVHYTGAYFDGKHIYKAYGGSLSYDPAERGIELEVSSDSATYDAGGDAVITVTASDTDGKKLSGATVLLSLVDEAAFAVSDQNAIPLETLYRFINYPSASAYASYIQHNGTRGGGGEKGGGGEEPVRKEFMDTAYFMSAVTGEDGTAKFTAKLPDNMTTWRATVLAVYQNDNGALLAGKNREPVVVTRPLFITPIVHSTFVEGDDVAVSAKCAGLPADGTITVTLTGSGVNETRTIKQQQTAMFGKLAKGSYTVLFTAESGDNKDAVELPLTVTDTLLETDIYKGVDLAELTKSVKPTKWPVYLALFNKEYMTTSEILCELLRYSGDSLDSRMASSFAAKELGFITEEDFIKEYTNETADGLARLLAADNVNIPLTALMAALDADALSPAAEKAFRDCTDPQNNNLQEICPAYMGLAALGKPVQDDVKKILTEKPTNYNINGIYLSAALALCGDYEAAYDAYIKYVPEIVINDSDPNAVTAYVPETTGTLKGKADQTATKTALITASLLDLPEAEYLARYLLGSKPEYSSYALELAIYVKNFTPMSKGEASFSYKMNGRTETVTLDRHRPTLIQLTEKQFAEADFTAQSGEIYVITDYVGRVSENDTAPKVTVTKKLTGSMAVGEKVTVTITAKPNCLIYDVVPSCGRLTGSQSGQLVRLFTGQSGQATYTFTVSTEGEYVVESPVVLDYKTGEWGIGEKTSITIGNANEAL